MFIKNFIKIILISVVSLVSTMNFNIINKCPCKIDIYSHENLHFHKKCSLDYNNNCLINIKQDIFESGLIKTTLSDEATLFEFTKNKAGIWYDISVIPPYNKKIQKKGFNIPLQVIVEQTRLNHRCNNLYCFHEKCQDAYLHPYDDIKTHYCNLNTNFTLIYC